MCKIRQANPDDYDALSAMGERFFAYSAFANAIPFDREAVRDVLARLGEGDSLLPEATATVLVAEDKGEIVGGIVGVLTAAWFNPQSRIATELAWWVTEAHRGGTAGIKLYRAFEKWAEAHKADAIVMSDLVIDGETPAAQLFEKLGYVTVERSHIKKGVE